MGYTTREVEKLAGLSGAQVRAFVRDGSLAPERGPRGEWRFTFQDLVLLRTARGLIDAEVPSARIRLALRRLRARLPAGAQLAGMHILADGRRIVVREGGALFQAESGQALFDFDVGELARGAASLASLERLQPAAAPGPPPPLARAASPAAEASSAMAVAVAPATADAATTHTAEAEALYQRGYALEDRDPTAARAAYQQALALDPDHLEAHVNLGRLLHDGGDPAGAERHYRAGLALRPDDVTAAFNLAVALEDLGRTDEAIATYQRSLALDPGCGDAHFNLARLFERLGRRLEAMRHLHAYRKLTRR